MIASHLSTSALALAEVVSSTNDELSLPSNSPSSTTNISWMTHSMTPPAARQPSFSAPMPPYLPPPFIRTWPRSARSRPRRRPWATKAMDVFGEDEASLDADAHRLVASTTYGARLLLLSESLLAWLGAR